MVLKPDRLNYNNKIGKCPIFLRKDSKMIRKVARIVYAYAELKWAKFFSGPYQPYLKM